MQETHATVFEQDEKLMFVKVKIVAINDCHRKVMCDYADTKVMRFNRSHYKENLAHLIHLRTRKIRQLSLKLDAIQFGREPASKKRNAKI